jgi:hypothetical protein
MKMLFLRALYVTILVGSLGLSPENIADRTTDILVFALPGTVYLDEGLEAAPITDVALSMDLLAVLEREGAEKVIRAIPNFDASNLTRISPSGKTVKLPDFSRLYRIRFPAGFDLDGIVAELVENRRVI